MALRTGGAIVLIVYRRFRLLVVYLATLVIVDWVVTRLLWVALPPPTVKPLVDGAPYGFPSRAVSAFAITLFSMAFVLWPGGPRRRFVRWVILAVLLLVIGADLYLAADYGVSMLFSATLAPAVAAEAFGWLTPEEAFPVSYRRGGTAAHLDLSGARGQAIVTAMADELGLVVTEVKPFGLEGSGGSSPLRMTLKDGSHVFGKIYSTSHPRADRWYRIGRTILYGQLEDETTFGSVRRLVTYEDYALTELQAKDQGRRTAAERPVQGARARPPAHLDPAVERTPPRGHGCGRRRRARSLRPLPRFLTGRPYLEPLRPAGRPGRARPAPR